MFVSGIVIPVEAMPHWEQTLALFLPMFYAADSFKGVILGTPADYMRDAMILMAWAPCSLTLASVLLQQRKATL